MSSISTITQAPGFDQQRYDSIIQQAQAEKVDTGLVNSLLLNAVKGGKSFDQALSMVGSEVPSLASPQTTSPDAAKKLYGIPSPGALIMSATTEFAAEQRRMNQEIMWQETEAVALSMKTQAEDMRNAAVTQLVLGCVSGAMQIGMGAIQVVGGALAGRAGMKAGNEASVAASDGAKAAGQTAAQATAAGNRSFTEMFSATTMRTNMIVQGLASGAGGAASMVSAGGQYVGLNMQALAKEMEADQEKMRAVRESVKNLDESLRDLIRRSLAAQQEIQASTNQARARILV